jgi:flagellar biosynthetic protein FliO
MLADHDGPVLAGESRPNDRPTTSTADASTSDTPPTDDAAVASSTSDRLKPGLHPFVEQMKLHLEPAWRRLEARFGRTKLLIGSAVAVMIVAAFLLPGGEHADPFDGPGGAIDLMVKLGAVLALAYVAMAALRRYTAGSVSQRGALLEVLDSTTLGPNRAVFVVRAGDRRLVLGVTQQQITALGDIDEQSGVSVQPSADQTA